MQLFLEIFLFFDYDRDSITEDVEVAMDIQHLKYFVEVVRQESFTRAAAQLFVTQPMLTRSIKQLEESLNVLLIERTSKSFHLTDAGRILYERAQEFLMQYEAIFQTMADVRSVKTGEVRLSIPGVLLDMYFPSCLPAFTGNTPALTSAWWRRAPSSPPPRWDWERRIWDWSCSRWRSRPALKATFWSAMCVSLW